MSAVGGGNYNRADGECAAVPGGDQNSAQGACAIAAGGKLNIAAGASSFAAGFRANAAHDGAFVWADRTDADFASTTTNQFAIRAQNGVVIQAQPQSTALELRGGAIKVSGAGVNTATAAFIHRATAQNVDGHITHINNPLCNGDFDALLIVTHNYSKDDAMPGYDTHPVGVFYDPWAKGWCIYHEDLAEMPVGRAFNVMIVKP
jgi:hypothetical protein